MLEIIKKIKSFHPAGESTYCIADDKLVSFAYFNENSVQYEVFQIENITKNNDFKRFIEHLIYEVEEHSCHLCNDCDFYNAEGTFKMYSHHNLITVHYTITVNEYELEECAIHLFDGETFYLPKHYEETLIKALHEKIKDYQFYEENR